MAFRERIPTKLRRPPLDLLYRQSRGTWLESNSCGFWMPADVSTLNNATDGSGDPPADSESIAYCADLSPFSGHMTQGTAANKPTYDATKKATRFDSDQSGAYQFLQISDGEQARDNCLQAGGFIILYAFALDDGQRDIFQEPAGRRHDASNFPFEFQVNSSNVILVFARVTGFKTVTLDDEFDAGATGIARLTYKVLFDDPGSSGTVTLEADVGVDGEWTNLASGSTSYTGTPSTDWNEADDFTFNIGFSATANRGIDGEAYAFAIIPAGTTAAQQAANLQLARADIDNRLTLLGST